MARRLILDTNILIDIERDALDRNSLPVHELALPVIVIAEFRMGIELIAESARARRAEAVLETMLEFCATLDYTLSTAVHHGRLSAEARRSGRPRGGYDLIIAAHAAETGDTILTRDAATRFGGLSGVRAIDPAELRAAEP